MTNLADSVKAGVKGIHGAGEVIRGETLDAADRLFDNNNHPATIQNESKNQTIAEKGRQDIRNADETFAARAGYEQRTGPAGVNQAGVTRPNEQVGSEMGSSTTGGRY
ncbi:hypothetical protein B0I35DRAFT_403336 [Stachybotrys elegans]|uniref:Uncharacterized protein n=1 Tax=Stachybotrys elegans TaxID=80388 RepID=A0A8K0T1Y6_9HYPO|nr:hypothetical protein B0I35DRAFT_403336 [Stachybotrys elegans]